MTLKTPLYRYTLPPGTVELRFQAISLAGLGPFTDWYNVTVLEIVEKPSSFGRFGVSLVISCVLCGLFYTSLWFKENYRRIFRQKPPVDRNEMEMLVMGIHEPNVDDDLIMHEISLDNVHFDEADFY